MTARVFGILTASLFALACSDGGAEQPPEDAPVTFLVTIENVSGEAMPPSPIAPGLWVIHEDGDPIFTEGEPDRGEGLERLAEDGAPDILTARLSETYEVGPFDPEKDSYETDAILPGETFEFFVTATPGQSLSIVSMLAASNDTFVGCPSGGCPLFDEDSAPVNGELVVELWNAGTEIDQPLGEGADQPANQAGPNTGEDEDGVVSLSGLDARAYVRVTVGPE